MGKYGEDSKLIYDLADQVGGHLLPSFTTALHSWQYHASEAIITAACGLTGCI